MLENNVNFERLQIFHLLCELQSFSLTGKALNINQSIVSRSIKELEKQLNKRLILNSHKPIILTNEGKKLYELTKNIGNEVNHIKENLHSNKNTNIDFENLSQYKLNRENKQFKVYISISMVLGCLLANEMKFILDSCKEVSIDIAFTNKIDFKDLNTKDFFIIKEPYKHIFVENELISSYEMVFGASKEYIKKNGYPKFIDSIPYHPFIYIKNYDYKSITSPEMFKNISTQYTIDNELCAIKSIEYGSGIGIMPKFAFQNFPNILTFDVEEKLKNFEVYIAISKIKKNNYTQILTNFFKERIQYQIDKFHDNN